MQRVCSTGHEKEGAVRRGRREIFLRRTSSAERAADGGYVGRVETESPESGAEAGSISGLLALRRIEGTFYTRSTRAGRRAAATATGIPAVSPRPSIPHR